MSKESASIMNNYRAVSGSKYSAARLKFAITRLRQETGMTEQGIIFRLLDYGISNHPEYSHFAPGIAAEWETSQKNIQSNLK